MSKDKNNNPNTLYQWCKLKLRKSKNNKNKHAFFCITKQRKNKPPKGVVIIYKLDQNEKWTWDVYHDFILDGSNNKDKQRILDKINFNEEIKYTIAYHEELLGMFIEIEKTSPQTALNFKINYWETLQPSCIQMNLNELDKNNVCGELIRQFILSYRK